MLHMALKFKNFFKARRLGMGGKLTLSILSIVVIMLISNTVAVTQFRRMSTYVSDRVSDNLTDINVSYGLFVLTDELNQRILGEVGRADEITKAGFDMNIYHHQADSLLSLLSERRVTGSDSLCGAYAQYRDMSLQLDSIIVSDFVDTRDWYFTSLQPRFDGFCMAMENVNKSLQAELEQNTQGFDDSFYRGILPPMIAVWAAVLLCLLLLFFILVFYVNPLKRMLRSLNAFREFGQPYKAVFEGDDQLQELNSGIADLAEDNLVLKNRLRSRER